MKKLVLFILVCVGLFVCSACSKNEDSQQDQQVTKESLNNTIWGSSGVNGIIAFKGDSISYRVNGKVGYKEKHKGTFTVGNGILKFKLDGETESRTIKVQYSYNQAYTGGKHLLLSTDEVGYDDFPYGECYSWEKTEWNFLFD